MKKKKKRKFGRLFCIGNEQVRKQKEQAWIAIPSVKIAADHRNLRDN